MDEEFTKKLIQAVPSQLLVTDLDAAGLAVRRMRSTGPTAPMLPNNKESAFLVSVQLRDFEHLRLWKDGTVVADERRPAGSLVIEDLRFAWQYEPLSGCDCVTFHIPFLQIRSFAMDAGRPQFGELHCPPGTIDSVILGLANALLPAFEKCGTANVSFLKQMNLAILTHLVHTYGGVHFPAKRKGTLASWQEKKVTEMLAASIADQIPTTDLAAACGLSAGYFTKAFKETFGKTPHRWLMEYRVIIAKEQLLTTMSIADIAASCGFADQSHLTRVFSEITGESPGSWRRRNRMDGNHT